MTDEADADVDDRVHPLTTRRIAGGEEDATPPEQRASSSHVDSRSLSGRTLAQGRFEVLQRLGEGGTGVVYEVEDHVRRERVALKTLARLEPAGVHRLKREFRSLVQVVHPNLVGLHELFCEDELWFFTMDLVRGTDLVSYVRGAAHSPPVPGSESSAAMLVRARNAMRQLVAGVDALHAEGKLHCDLKPSNVLVTETGKLSVLDFGLVTEARERPGGTLVEAGLCGTPDYLAPERVAGAPATAACDWYAVGVVLFEALTGQLPYQGDRFLALHRRATSLPPSPKALAPDLPDAVDAVCVALLQPDPARRADGRTVLAAFGDRPRSDSGTRSRAADAESPQLVGREAELQVLDDALLRVESGASLVVRLPGLSGMGKSALLAEYMRRLQGRADVVVLSGRCHQWESVPYKSLDAVIDELAHFWRSLAPSAGAELVPRDVLSLVRVFPVLGEVEAVARATQNKLIVRDPQELRNRAFGALRDLLRSLARRYVLVVAIDDLQWGDRESARELVELLCPPDPPSMLVLCAYRADEVHPDGPLAALLSALEVTGVEARELPVGPLNDTAARALAVDLAGDRLRDEAVRDIVREADGSPFFLGELVRSGSAPSAGQQPLTLSTVVQLRLGDLSRVERELLDLLVVSPGPVQGDVLREASGLSAAFDGALRSLLARGLVRTRGGRARDLVEPYHDRIREAVATALSSEARGRHHAAFVDVLQVRLQVDPEVLAVHFEGAGQPVRAARQYERAARRSLEALAFDHAATLFRKALDLGEHGPSTRSEVETRLAEALAYAGRGPESAEAYQAAADHGPLELRNYLRLHAAEQYLYAGHNQSALALLEDVLPAFGVRLPKSRAALVAHLVFDGLRLARRAPGRVLPPSQRDARAARRARVCATLGDAVLYVDFGLFAYFQQRHVLHGLASGEPGRVAEALTTRAMLTASPYPHKFDSIADDLALAEEIARGVEDPEVRGRIVISRAIVYSAAGRYVETERLAREAERIFRGECQGVKWGLQLAVLWQSVALFYLGRFEDLDTLCRTHLPHAHRRGDRMLSKLLAIWQAWAELAAGHPHRAERVSPVPSLDRDFTILDAGVITQRGPMLLHQGKREEAWELFLRGEPLVRRSGVLRARTRAFEFHWTRGLCAAHLLQHGATNEVARVLESDIRELASSRTVDSAAMAEHLRGAQAGARGERGRAAAHYREAAAGYESHAMAAFAATLRLAAAHAEGEAESAEAGAAESDLLHLGVQSHADWLSLWCPGWKDA